MEGPTAQRAADLPPNASAMFTFHKGGIQSCSHVLHCTNTSEVAASMCRLVVVIRVSDKTGAAPGCRITARAERPSG
mgnify:CR=1 FL=1